LKAPLIAGALSHAVAHGVLQPFDVIKTRMIREDNPGAKHSSHTRMIPLVVRIVGQEGFSKLWRGTYPSVVRVVLGSSVYFPCQNLMLFYLRDGNQGISKSHALFIGFASRVMAIIVGCPVTVLKTRIEAYGKSGRLEARGIIRPLWNIAQDEGIRGLYSGLGATTLKDAPYAALYLMFYTQIKKHIGSWKVFSSATKKADETGLSEYTGPLQQLTAGFLAGTITTILTHPPDVLKTRLQIAKIPREGDPPIGGLHRDSRMSDAFSLVMKESGISGFFRGLLPRIFKRSTTGAISWMAYEQIMEALQANTHL